MSQVKDLTELTLLDQTDLLYIVEDPAGVPAGKKVTLANLRGAVTTVTDTYQVLSTDACVVGNKGTGFTITLPEGVAGLVAMEVVVKNIGVGTVTLEGSGSDTIDGGLNLALLQWESVRVKLRAANTWIIIG